MGLMVMLAGLGVYWAVVLTSLLVWAVWTDNGRLTWSDLRDLVPMSAFIAVIIPFLVLGVFYYAFRQQRINALNRAQRSRFAA